MTYNQFAYSHRRIYQYDKYVFRLKIDFYYAIQTAWIPINVEPKRSCKLSGSLCLLVNLLFEKNC